MPRQPLVLINAVGLTTRLLAEAPRLSAIAARGWARPVVESLPAVTCTAQATILTGEHPSRHGVVANGWHYRDTAEVRFWQQSNALIQAEPLYVTAKRRAERRGGSFRTAKLFWWFNQGAAVEQSVTPKPYYGADGNKAFDIAGTPVELPERLKRDLGPFPFPAFWGPRAGADSTSWIARCAAEVIRSDAPDLTLVYLPHLDYEPQRTGPSGCDMPRLVRELDAAATPLLDAAAHIGAKVFVVSEYGHCDVSHAVAPNRILRRAGLLDVRPGPFGETLDTFTSRAFAVCDHQLAHIYVRNPDDVGRTTEALAQDAHIATLLSGEARAKIHLDHARSGEIIALANADAWFAYPFWLDDRQAPDYARTVDIHRKPGFDPCELFVDPKLHWPALRIARRLAQKKLGFRTLFDVIPLDASLVKGSHGLNALNSLDQPLLIGDGTAPCSSNQTLAMTAVRDVILEALGLPD